MEKRVAVQKAFAERQHEASLVPTTAMELDTAVMGADVTISEEEAHLQVLLTVEINCKHYNYVIKSL